MLVEQRHKLIIEKINKDKSVRSAELMEKFEVSFETIRKDFIFLGEG